MSTQERGPKIKRYVGSKLTDQISEVDILVKCGLNHKQSSARWLCLVNKLRKSLHIGCVMRLTVPQFVFLNIDVQRVQIPHNYSSTVCKIRLTSGLNMSRKSKGISKFHEVEELFDLKIHSHFEIFKLVRIETDIGRQYSECK